MKHRDGLLPRMEAIKRKTGFSYGYHPIGAKPIILGSDKVAAVRKVLDMLGARDDPGTIGKLCEQRRNEAPELGGLFRVLSLARRERWSERGHRHGRRICGACRKSEG